MAVTDAEVRVPDDETGVRCPECGRPFRNERLRALHVGDLHDATDEQLEAYEEAREAERADLFYYHLKVVAALVAVYAFFMLTYMAVSLMQIPG